MSGRGVITSRTSVSPKSTMDCSSRRSSPSIRPCPARPSRCTAFAASLGLRRRAVVRRRRARAGRSRGDQPHERSRSAGASDAGDDVERGSSTSSTRSGSRRDDQQRQQRARRRATNTASERRAACRSTVSAVDADAARASSTVASDGDEPEQQPHRDEQQQRIVEIGAEALGAAAALRHQAQRQPHQRAERRLDRAEVDRGAREQEQQRAGSSARSARSIRPFARGRPCAAAALRARAIRPVVASRDRSRAGAAGRAAPGPAARCCYGVARPRAPGAGRRRGR